MFDRCISYNCKSDNKCGRAADEPIHPGSWVYVIIALGIIGCESTRYCELHEWRLKGYVSHSRSHGSALVLPQTNQKREAGQAGAILQ
jgi:hypothetical protein